MKTRMNVATYVALAIILTLFSACVLVARGDEKSGVRGQGAGGRGQESKGKDVKAQLDKVKESLAPTYVLAYKFAKGEQFRTKVVHLATIETKIKGVAQTTKSRTVSTRQWRIKDVAANGHITFENIVDRVEMWNSVEGRQELKYDSATDDSPPPEFAHVAAAVGKVLATVTIDPAGRILSRQNAQPHFNPGIGELTIPFPTVAVKVGATWSIPEDVRIRMENGSTKKVETRQQYRLEKLAEGVATISLETQVLTPINDPKIQVELIQRLQRGTIKFDVDAGRLIHKQLDMDQSVFGYSGDDSHMQYLARFTEEPLPREETTAQGSQPEPTKR